MRFRVERNPFAGLLLDALESRHWLRKFIIGVQQSGKTLLGSLIPLMYHLFERKETVVFGVPSRDMIKDKWENDILPVIGASRYRDLLPTDGQGSRGGTPLMVHFRNGAGLRFMSAGGNDKTRAGFTSRILIVTEVDGFDEIGGKSREASKFDQLEGRVRAFAKCDPLVYGECTVSYDTGRIWREYNNGTRSRLAIRCPHCASFVSPCREHLTGWQNAADEITAGEKAALVCPACGAAWSEADRDAANRDVRLVHRGQEIDAAGNVTGELPRTRTLGFRWNAANNLLVGAADTAQEEWRSKQDPDEENAEKRLLQFVWALPHKPETVDLTQLDATIVASRVTLDKKGIVPSGYGGMTVGVDVGIWLCHWTASAWKDADTPHVVEYGVQEVKSDQLERDRALLVALRSLRDGVFEKGFESDEGRVVPDTVLIDSGYAGKESEHLEKVVYAFCAESNEKCGRRRYLPAKGWGDGQYKHPVEKGKRVREIGREWHAARMPEYRGIRLIHANASHWKSKTHDRLRAPAGQPGSMTIFYGDGKDHLSFGKHLTAERQEKNDGVVEWIAVRRANHWLDSTMLSQVAGNRAGDRLFDTDEQSVLRTAPPASSDAAEDGAATDDDGANDVDDGFDGDRDGLDRGKAEQSTGWFAGRKKRR